MKPFVEGNMPIFKDRTNCHGEVFGTGVALIHALS